MLLLLLDIVIYCYKIYVNNVDYSGEWCNAVSQKHCNPAFDLCCGSLPFLGKVYPESHISYTTSTRYLLKTVY